MTATDLGRNNERLLRYTQRLLLVWLIGGAAALAVSVGVAALGSASGLLPLPYALALVDERLPVIFRLHMAASGVGLILLPAVLLARRRPQVHRPLGIAAACALAIGLAASLPSALASAAEPLARAGFFAQGALSLSCLATGVWAGRRRHFDLHRMAMASLAALVSGAVVLRLMLYAVIALRLPFEPSYTAIAWACWLLPLATLWVSWWMARRRNQPAAIEPGARIG